MQINFAHLREPSTTGGWINFAVFDAHATSNSESAKAQALAQLTAKARMAGYKVDQSALAFNENGRLQFYGTKNLVDHLARSWRPHWTHTMTV
jgi:hypothetical protein